MDDTLSANERSALLQTRATALAGYERVMAALTGPAEGDSLERILAGSHFLSDAESAEAEYFRRLPVVVMGCCPFDGKPLRRRFDPWGLDGPWWRSDATPAEPEACPHFFALTGALAIPAEATLRSAWDVYPGPDLPFVIPRLLHHPTAVAVICRLETHFGVTAHVISYFASQRPKPELRTAHWCRSNFVHTSHFGVHAWRIPDDPYDFDLASWTLAGKLRWCDATDGTATLADATDTCPFLDLAGDPRPAVVTRRGVLRFDAPNGRIVVPGPLM